MRTVWIRRTASKARPPCCAAAPGWPEKRQPYVTPAPAPGAGPMTMPAASQGANELRHIIHHRIRLFDVWTVATVINHQLARIDRFRSDRIELRGRSILVIAALHRQQGASDRRQQVLDIPVHE